MEKYDIIILGGGASGLMCAANIEEGKTVAIIEAGFSLGKKILVTGNGRCNLTNINMSSQYFNNDIDCYLEKFDEKDTIKYFNSIGLDTFIDEQGRVYPFTNYAKSVVDVLTKKILRNNNIKAITGVKVANVDIVDNKYILSDNNKKYMCDKLVVATGNIDNQFATTLGIKVGDKFPSLVALKTKESTKNLEGVRINNVKVSAVCNGKKMSQCGEVMFKDNGLSGIVIFNISTLFARNKSFNGEVIIDLLPNKTDKQAIEMIKARCKIFDKVVDMFDGLFVAPVREEIFKRCKLDEQIQTSKLSDSVISQISKVIHNLGFNVNGHYENFQVISGGIALNELTDNLECKKYNNLYFTGEAIDIDGECGGYNLQWAWTSGIIVGKSISISR